MKILLTSYLNCLQLDNYMLCNLDLLRSGSSSNLPKNCNLHLIVRNISEINYPEFVCLIYLICCNGVQKIVIFLSLKGTVLNRVCNFLPGGSRENT